MKKKLSSYGLCKMALVLLAIALSFLSGGYAEGQVLQTRTRYAIHPGDVLDVRFRLTPEYNQSAAVEPDGFITLTIAGEVKVANLTVRAAQDAILKASLTRLKDPEVTVTLTSFEKPYFVVAGRVFKPGRFDMQADTTALQAVMLAGGFETSAKSSQILVYRRINGSGGQVLVLNLKKIKDVAGLERDVTLESGDMIYVPPSKLSEIADFLRIGTELGLYFNPLTAIK